MDWSRYIHVDPYVFVCGYLMDEKLWMGIEGGFNTDPLRAYSAPLFPNAF
jgi:hypothetical protein